MQRVLIIQAEMKHYRSKFFHGLYEVLQKDDIQLTVGYSNSHAAHAPRSDRDELQLPVGLKVTGRWFFGKFIYQPLWKQILESDLVIIGPEVKYLNNPLLMILSTLGLKTVAFWGLGPNRYPDRSELAENFKKHFFTFVDWWFAYTASIAEYLKDRGMPSDRITIVQNATDTAELRSFIAEISEEDAALAKLELTGSSQSRIGLYIGALEPIKALPMLLKSAREVKKLCPEFHLVMIGDGSERGWLEAEIVNEPWIHYLGFKNHSQSAIFYKTADVCVLAGTVGLAVVDCYAAELPLVATRLETHPPEISYVIDGYNGLLVEHGVEALSAAILLLFSDTVMMERLRAGARECGAVYTMEAMIENYRAGINRCLARYRSSSSNVVDSLASRADR